MFPNSQVAGLMKSDGETMKKVSPFYYFCMPLPEGLSHRGVTDLQVSGRDAKRVDARIDESRGLLYLVYFPDQEKPGESVVLRFKAMAAAGQSRRPSK
jgi:hypothetical protein